VGTAAAATAATAARGPDVLHCPGRVPGCPHATDIGVLKKKEEFRGEKGENNGAKYINNGSVFFTFE
jgi:hypothetical protein